MYRLKLNVSSCTVRNTVIEDHEPRDREFWGDKLEGLLSAGFLEEVKEPQDEIEEVKEPQDKKSKKGV